MELDYNRKMNSNKEKSKRKQIFFLNDDDNKYEEECIRD